MNADRLVVGVPRETSPGEARVALVPSVLARLIRAGLGVVVEAGAGVAAGFPDRAYAEHGARLGTRNEVLAADVVVRVRVAGADLAPDPADLDRSRPAQIVIGMADALDRPGALQALARRKVTTFALELLPRITRAQVMDVLSSQATVVGYRAVVMAADRHQKMFPMLTTAAGTVPPAQVLVLGAGVAGLVAIATARRLGAVVEAYDVRPAARDEIESLGARSVTLPNDDDDVVGEGSYARALGAARALRQQELLALVVAGADVVIATAQVPGAKAPVLVSEHAVLGMRPGSVIVDCAAERGGNCALTRPDEVVVTGNHVTVLGPTDLASQGAHEASEMYARNMVAFLLHLIGGGGDGQRIDPDDEIVAGTLVTAGGEIVHPRVVEALGEVAA
jgi:NAD(P) transhydrogenase subunit alpha